MRAVSDRMRMNAHLLVLLAGRGEAIPPNLEQALADDLISNAIRLEIAAEAPARRTEREAA